MGRYDELMALPQESPADWKARVDYDAWPDRTDTARVFVHWFGTPVSDAAASGRVESERAAIRSAERFHIEERGWAGLAYDWIVGQSGRLYRARGISKSAATYGHNARSDAVLVLVGKGQTPSDAALATLEKVLDALAQPVYLHREALELLGKGTATSCPGDTLAGWVDAYRAGKAEGGATPPADASAPEKRAPKAPAGKKKAKKGATGGRKGEKGKLLVKIDPPLLKRGAADRMWVRRLQGLLNAQNPSARLVVDGRFGPKTGAEVRRWQRVSGLKVDELVGPKTWASLFGGKVVG